MKKINIVFRSTGVGLDQDAAIVKEALEQIGCSCTLSKYKELNWLKALASKKNIYDANIFLERVHPRWLHLATKNYLIPNQERFPKRQLKRLKNINTILCKTKHAENIFSNLGYSTFFTSFTSRDKKIKEFHADYSKFFHLAGKSTLKGTEDILKLWEKHSDWPELTLVQHASNAPDKVPRNVNLISDFLSEEKLLEIQNTHGIHLCPSRSEGWGHYITEAMSCGALIITTDAPPMNELISENRGLLTKTSHSEERHLGFNFFVSVKSLEERIQYAIDASEIEKKEYGHQARIWFDENNNRFKELLSSVFTVTKA